MKPQTTHKLFTLWILTLTLVMTPWLSFWTTPVLASNDQGETVVLCTLKGLQRVAIKADISANGEHYSSNSIIAEPVAEDNEYCSALQLIKAFSQGLQTPSVFSNLPNYPIQFAHAGQYAFRLAEPFSAYTGRAPPTL